MGTTLIPGKSTIERRITLPSKVAEKIDKIAASRRVSPDRATTDLLSDGIDAYEQRRKTFLDLTDRFQKSTDPAETERLREELARLTFGG